jgi:hypothetical protein
MKVNYFDTYSLAIAAAMSILIGYQYKAIEETLSTLDSTFAKLSPLFIEDEDGSHQHDDENNPRYKAFSHYLKTYFHEFQSYYLPITFSISVFIILLLNDIINYKYNQEFPPFFYLVDSDRTIWSLFFDIINGIVQCLILILLVIYIWIMIKLFNTIGALNTKYKINIKVFDLDGVGGLKPIRTFVLKVVTRFYVIITLVMISYMSPTMTIFYRHPSKMITDDMIILSPLLVIGLAIFIKTQETTSKLIDKGIKLELKKIDNKYEEIFKRVNKINCNITNTEDEKELEKLRITMDILENARKRINEMKRKKYDFIELISFVTTALLPILTKEVISFITTVLLPKS